MKLGIVSQQVLLRKALCALLAGAGLFSTVIELDSVSDLVDIPDQSQTLVVLVHAPDPPSGIQSVCELRHRFPGARALLISNNPNEEFCAQALEAGAWGSLSTADSPQVLFKAVSKVADGERWFDRGLTNKVISKLIARRGAESTPVDNLTPREWEVLALIARGHSDKEIASLLFISKETAHTHVKSIYKKLQVSTRRAAAVYYFEKMRNKGVPPLPAATRVPNVA